MRPHRGHLGLPGRRFGCGGRSGGGQRGLLCLRGNEDHRKAAEANDIELIELVVVNLVRVAVLLLEVAMVLEVVALFPS